MSIDRYPPTPPPPPGPRHAWVPSTLGHGDRMCKYCKITDREAAVLGVTDTCDSPVAVALRQRQQNAEKRGQLEVDGLKQIEDSLRTLNGHMGELSEALDSLSATLKKVYEL